jgi:RNA polymerase sigma-70 factor (sigma-E family)
VEVLLRSEVGFAGFVREHTPALLRTAYLLTGNALAAEELVQDTMARLYPKWERVEAADVPIAYVRRSMANGYVNQRRRASRREYAYADVPETIDVRDVYAQLSDRDEIWAGLNTLPERQRAALVLRYFEDLPDDEIARTLDARVGTVRSLISRGLATLREQMTDEYPPGGLPPGAGRTA